MNTHLSWSWRAPPADLPWSCYAWFLGLPRPTHVELLTLQSAKKQNDFRLELIFPLFLFTVSLFYTTYWVTVSLFHLTCCIYSIWCTFSSSILSCALFLWDMEKKQDQHIRPKLLARELFSTAYLSKSQLSLCSLKVKMFFK